MSLTLIRLALGDAPVDVRLMDVSAVHDLESTAGRFLTPPEQAEYAELRHPLRRREWLGARVCLKLMVSDQGVVDDPLQCAVVKDPRGRPRLVPALEPTDVELPDCSLSHKGPFVCAATALTPGSKVGVDVEEVSPRLLRLARAFTHERDTLLGERPDAERLTILWALKEACSKVVGRGIALGLRDVVCEEIAPGRHRVSTGGLALAGWHTIRDGYVVALCRGEEREIEPEPRVR